MAEWDDKADALFQQHTISEIQSSHNKINRDIDKKRQELRTMVGGKYRQLLEAADDMIAMAKVSAQVVASIDGLKHGCEALHNEPETRSSSISTSSGTDMNDPIFTVGVQVKLLLDSPERIWGCLETDDYELAVYTFYLARFVHKGLSAESAVMQQFPLLRTQWSNVMEFEQRIRQHAQQTLAQPTVGLETARAALVSLALLEDKPIEQLLETFLKARKDCLDHLWSETETVAVETKAWLLCQAVIHSLHLAELLFHHQDWLAVDNNDIVTLSTRLAQLAGSEGQDICRAWQRDHLFSDNPMAAEAPDAVQNYTLSYTHATDDIKRSQLHASLKAWLNGVADAADGKSRKLLRQATSVTELVELQRDVELKIEGMTKAERLVHLFEDDQLQQETKTALLEQAGWEQLCQDLVGQSVVVWDLCLRHNLLARAENLMAAQFKEAASTIVSTLSTCIQEDISTDTRAWRDVLDVSSYCWDPERVTNYDFGLAESDENKVELVQGCREAAFGLFGHGATAIRRFESDLKAVQEMATLLLQAQTRTKAALDMLHRGAEDMSTDTSTVNRFLQTGSESCVEQLRDQVNGLVNTLHQQLSDSAVASWIVGSQLALVSRCLHAIAFSCPTLEQLVLAPDSAKTGYSARSRSVKKSECQERLAKLQSTLDAQAEATLLPWLDMVVSSHQQLLRAGLSAMPLANMASLLSGWQSHSIEETSEDGSKQSSFIHLPMTPSTSLLNALCGVASEVARAGLSGMHSSLHVTLTTKTRAMFTSVYRDFLAKRQETPATVCQDGLLQLLVDVNFLSDITALSAEKDELATFRKQLRAGIDPFDLDVYEPYLVSLRANSYHRSATLLGLFANIHPMHQHNRGTLSSTEKHNCLALAKPPPRFAPLPIGGTESGSLLSETSLFMDNSNTSIGTFLDAHAQDHASLFASFAQPQM
eukprot:m.223513 g.223513  ORF g.223513 m.223513 type:complete len:936 (-) comp17271_c0_seq2:16-2823(-)